MATTTNFGWETPDDTDLVKDGAAAMRTLGNSIDTSFVDLKGGTTGQVLAKASNTDLDYTWVAQDDSNAIQNAIVDAKGDLISATGADTPARLAVGTNGQILQADSTTATGLKWATPAGGGKVLQVVQATTTTSVSTTGTADTGLTATITPSSSSSKILVLVSQHMAAQRTTGSPSADLGGGLYLKRNGTTIFNGAGGTTGGIYLYIQGVNSVTVFDYSRVGINYLDSPATTSAVTYKTTIDSYSASVTLYAQNNSAEASMILMEIGA